MSATLNTTNNGGYQPVCQEHHWADQVFYSFELACKSVDEHNAERHGDPVHGTVEGRAESERIHARVRKATYVQALAQAEAELRAGVADAGRRLVLKRLVRTLRAVMDEGGGTDGLDEGDSH